MKYIEELANSNNKYICYSIWNFYDAFKKLKISNNKEDIKHFFNISENLLLKASTTEDFINNYKSSK